MHITTVSQKQFQHIHAFEVEDIMVDDPLLDYAGLEYLLHLAKIVSVHGIVDLASIITRFLSSIFNSL
jgi:hypothetical protein